MHIRNTRKVMDRIRRLMTLEEQNELIRSVITEPVEDGIVFRDFAKIDGLAERYRRKKLDEGVFIMPDEAKSVIMLSTIMGDVLPEEDPGEGLPAHFFDELFESSRFFKKDDIAKDPYLSRMEFPEESGPYEFRTDKIPKYSPFFYAGPELYEPGNSIPRIGFIDRATKCVKMTRNGRDYTTVNARTVLEENTISRTFAGKCLVLGVGAGHFPYLAALNPETSGIILMDGDEDELKLYGDVMADQIPYKEKIATVQADPMLYVMSASDGAFDCIYISSYVLKNSCIRYLFVLKKMQEFRYTRYAFEAENEMRDDLRRLTVLVLAEEAGLSATDPSKLSPHARRRHDMLKVTLDGYIIDGSDDIDALTDPDRLARWISYESLAATGNV